MLVLTTAKLMHALATGFTCHVRIDFTPFHTITRKVVVCTICYLCIMRVAKHYYNVA